MGLTKNQRLYKVPSRELYVDENFLFVNRQELEAAFKILKPTEFIVWFDGINSTEDYARAFSPQEISMRYGISLSSAQSSFTGLLAKGFFEEVGEKRYYLHTKSQLPENAHYYAAELSVEDDW